MPDERRTWPSSQAPSFEGAAFHVVNLGCKVNRVESDEFAAKLLAQGGRAVPPEAADVIIVNTCTVTGEAEKKARKAVRAALRANDFSQVLVTGCAAAIDPAAFESMDARVRVVSKARMGELMSQPGAPVCGEGLLRVGEGFHTRVGVKVQDGCNNACTFCIVHVARGRATSRKSADVVAEVRALVAAGVREVVLTGINLGSYRDGSMRLPGLLRCVLDAIDEEASRAGFTGCGPFARVRISSIEPRDVDDEFIELLAASEGHICRHLHLPLQAGSSKVLHEMARPYDAQAYLALVERIRAIVPELSLSTDVIAGFPGETEADFADTLSVCEACAFSKMHVFRYSRREGTPAAARTDQVSPGVKAARAHELDALSQRLREADFSRRQGTREFALVEAADTATTESYHAIRAPEGAHVGDLVECVL